jgi:hypothetical protein
MEPFGFDDVQVAEDGHDGPRHHVKQLTEVVEGY